VQIGKDLVYLKRKKNIMLPTFDIHPFNFLPEQLQNSKAVIFPFKECAALPAENNTGIVEKQAIHASELFLIFTADIINKKAVFTR
jgi:hypothetical protein